MISFRSRAFRWILWNLFSRPFVYIYIRAKYNYHISPSKFRFPKPPFIYIANHGTFFDPWMVGGLSKYPLAIMMNDDGFRSKGITPWYLKSIGAFPKKKGASDMKAMKKTLDQLAHKYPVLIFPEGQCSWDGETQLLYRGIERIVLKAKCPLVIANFTGNFLTKPWWAVYQRKGRVDIRLKTIPAEDLALMTSDQLFGLIKESLYHNDIKDESNRKFHFTGHNVAEGLERFVWVCMECSCEDKLTMKGNTIQCTECGTSWTMDSRCRLQPLQKGKKCYDDLKDWSDFHKSFVKKKIHSSCDETVITTSENCVLQTEDATHDFTTKDTGNLSLNKNDLVFNSANQTIHWQIDRIRDCVIQRKDIMEFRYDEIYIRFLFDHRSPMKWVYYLRYLTGYQDCEDKGYL